MKRKRQAKLASNSKSSTRKQRHKLSRWQEKFVLEDFDAPLRIACTGVSAGKSRALAWWLVMQMVKKPKCRCIAVAQTHKALKRVLIRELQVVCSVLHIKYEYNKSEQEFTLCNGSVLFGYSGENATAMLGLSEIDILAMDESAYIPEEAYQYASDRMRGGLYEPMVRLISSPQSMAAENWFSDIVKKNENCVVHASALDNPFTSERFKQGLKDRYGEGSNLYRQQVLGEIFDFDIATQIVMRKDFVSVKTSPNAKGYWMGCDFAGGVGADSDCCVIIDDSGVVEWKQNNELNTQQKVGVISQVWDLFNPDSGCGDSTGGYGNGSLDLLDEKGKSLTRVNFENKAFDEKEYPNARTEMYIELAKDIKAGFWVPEEAKVELLAIQAVVNKRGQISLIPKELVKKALGGKSPDLADAIALANYARRHGGRRKEEGYTAKQASAVAARLMALRG